MILSINIHTRPSTLESPRASSPILLSNAMMLVSAPLAPFAFGASSVHVLGALDAADRMEGP